VRDDTSTGAWWARQAIATLPLAELGADFLMSWAAEMADRRPRILTEVLGPPRSVPLKVHARLLAKYAEQGVSGALFGTFISGTTFGSETAWARGKLDEANRWLHDDRPEIREWAAGVVKELEAMVQRAELREAEERFR
jgi:hypothetical protein